MQSIEDPSGEHLANALEQLDAIHAHLARGEQYRGYRPAALALSGLGGLLAAAAQPWLADEGGPAFVRYWMVVAVACAVLAGGITVMGYLLHDALTRRRTRTVLGHFLPCLAVGALLGAAFAADERLGPAIRLLPALWCLVFGLGTVASLPYLPRPALLVAGWYFVWGAALLWHLPAEVPSGWSVALPFGLGQLFAAAVLLAAGPTREERS